MMVTRRGITSEDLLDAVRKGDKEIVKKCITCDSLAIKDWKGGYKFLNLALAYKEYEIARILLDKVTHVNNQSDRPERTPLHYAATDNKVDILKKLLNKGADVNAIDEHDMSPLHYAVILDNLETVQLLLDHGATATDVTDHVFRFTPYQHACKSSKYQVLESFLNHGCSPNDVFDYPDNLICPKGSSPLHMAITQKNLDTISLLLDRNADVNHFNENKETSLHLACRENSEEIVRLLINKKAKINIENKEQTTPLHIAVRNGNVEIVKSLLANDANTESEDRDGKIPLQLAVEERDTEIVNCLLERNHDVKNENHRRAFKAALLKAGLRSVIFRSFVKRGFELSPKEINEVAFVAVKKGFFHILENLLELSPTTSGVNLLTDARNEDGDTLLHCATKNKQHDIVRLLISRKADEQALNSEGNPPIVYAIENNNEDIVKTFLTEGSVAKSYPLLLHTIIQIKKNKSRRLLETALQNGADVNQRDNDLQDMTALHLICRETMACDVELADLLLRKGADVDATTAQGSTALHMAAARSDSELIIRTLLKFDPDIDVKDHSGITPLHLAASKACVSTISLLLDAGSSINIEDNLGLTPVDVIFSVKKSLPQRQPGQYFSEEASRFETKVNESVTLLRNRVTKLHVAKMSLHKNNLKYLPGAKDQYIVKCEKELSDIKNNGINSYVTMHDILMKNIRKIVRYTREDDAKTSLELVEYKRKYPIYGSIIDNIIKAIMREYELNKAKDAINILTGYGLPDACTENIFEYLRTKELKNLSIATNLHVDVGIKT